MKKGKERARVLNAVRRSRDKKKLRKYSVTKTKDEHVNVGRYETTYKVKDLSTGNRYKAVYMYGPLGGTWWDVEKLKKGRRKR